MTYPQRVDLHPTFILHQRPYSETSLQLELLSSKYGRVAAIAKGAKRERSKLRGILQPFLPLLVGWTGRGEVVTLTQAEPAAPPLLLSGRKLLSGFYLNELLARVLHRHDPHPDIFAWYGEALEQLAGEGGEEPVLRRFEKKLLAAIGYALQLQHNVDNSNPLQDECQYYYQRDKGPLLEPSPTEPTLCIRGATLSAIAEDRYDDPIILREAKQLMRFVLHPHLGDKPLYSRQLFSRQQITTDAATPV